ncbi:MAG: hypothetical protein DMD81_25695 [Candidatus Rokuibacteriota bacterium]|nr:MAG: hypothetical protein DMD81_25695 [Candidatus Rokubacteria bacterium]
MPSVTTIRANFVGSSVVSAMTQTPPSGPLGPETTPPMSLPPIVIPGGADGACAFDRVCTPAMRRRTIPTVTIAADHTRVTMSRLLVRCPALAFPVRFPWRRE